MKMAIGLAWVVVGQDELLTALLEARDARCENRGTVPDAEVEKIASWAWRKRCENRLYTNRDSEFPVDRQMLDRLKGQEGAEDAIGLFRRAHRSSQPLSGQNVRPQLREDARSRSYQHV